MFQLTLLSSTAKEREMLEQDESNQIYGFADLTSIQNLLLGQKLSEYHTGYRAYSIEVLKAIDYNANSDDFIFDNQVIAQIFEKGFEIAEITCPTKYFSEASSINLSRSIKYGIGVLGVSFKYWFKRLSH